jgi:type III secretion system YscQ/HrcQ family protein
MSILLDQHHIEHGAKIVSIIEMLDMSRTPLKLAEGDAPFVRLTNLLFRCPEIALTGDRTLRWFPWRQKHRGPALVGKFGSETATISLQPWPSNWFDVRSVPSDVPSDEIRCIYEVAAADALKMFEELFGVEFLCEQLVSSRSVSRRAVGFEIRTGADISPIVGWISASPELFISVRQRPAEATRWQERYRNFRSSSALIVGKSTLDAASTKTLLLGDVIRLDDPPADLSSAYTYFCPTPGSRCVGHVYDKQFQLEMIVDDQTYDSPTRDDANCVDVNMVPVVVTFEVGRVSYTMAQLSSLSPGVALPVTPRVDELQVRIVANGALIGRGELMSLNGEVAVVITELSGT